MTRDADLDALRRFAVGRSLFTPTTLQRAVERFGFVQADPIRAPARAQDLTLRHRVHDYRAGDLERHYAALGVEEDFFVNYGFLPRAIQSLMHPRATARRLAMPDKRARALLAFVRDRGEAHPREVHDHFAHGTVTNYWGGSSNATTHLLDTLHYRGLLRIARRDSGIRVYALQELTAAAPDPSSRRARLDALVDVIVGAYAPLPALSLSSLVRRLRYGVPQWRGDLESALTRARRRLAHTRIDGVEWYWPADEDLRDGNAPDAVRFLAPFDPIVWDRRRFEQFWRWRYRFEAYTPAAKRAFGYYALPILWRDDIVGWSNLSIRAHTLDASFGYVRPRLARDRHFRQELDAEIERMRQFLGRESPPEPEVVATTRAPRSPAR